MHERSKRQLRNLAERAMDKPQGTQRRQAFLDGLGSIHLDWHASARRHGFLLFHWELIKYFKQVGAPAEFGGIRAFTKQDFEDFGRPYDVSVAVDKQDIGSLKRFSRAIENWHNHAHHHVGMATGVDLMDAETNIYEPEFWRLHYFINQRFEAKLRDFRRRSNQSIPRVVEGIEAQHHRAVPSI